MKSIHRNFLSSEVFQRHDESTNHLQLYLSRSLLVTLATFSACSTLYNWHNTFSLRQTTPLFSFFVYAPPHICTQDPIRLERSCRLTILDLERECMLFNHLSRQIRPYTCVLLSL
jgi:hypothetical protein